MTVPELEIERLNRLYSALSHINQAIVRKRTRDELFHAVCEVLVAHGGFGMAWIGWHDAEAHTLAPVAQAGDEGGYLRTIEVYTDDRAQPRGPIGTAFRESRTYICNDILEDPIMLPWRAELARRGFFASAAFPIRANSVVCGTLSVYANSRGFFRDKEIALLAEAAADVSFAVDNLAHEEARQRAEEIVKRFVAIVESTDDAIVSTTLDGTITSWNPAAQRMFGYCTTEILGRPMEILIPADRAEEEPLSRRRIRSGEHIEQFETICVRKDGALFPVSVTVSPIWSPDEGAAAGTTKIVGISKIVRDITERKKAEAIAESQQRFASGLIEAMPGIFYLYDKQGRFLRWNRNFETVSGYSGEEIAQMHPLDFFSSDEKPLLQQRIAEVFERGDATVEASLVSRDGRAAPHFFTGRCIVLDGAPHLVGVGVDISERKHAEKALRELNENLEHMVVERTIDLDAARERAEVADRLKSAFLATMSHELRTPLNSILGFTGIVLKGMAGPLNPEQSKQLGMVQGSARHLLDLINDVLDISKIEAGQLKVRCAQFDLRASIERVTASVMPLANSKGLALRVDVQQPREPMESDQRRVEQILLNLLNNAIKFTDRGSVTLTAEVVDDFDESGAGETGRVVRVRVADTGIGMKHEDLSSLFQPFRQLDSGLQRQHEGTGLGLAICRRLAALLGGVVRAESVWGQGSVFTLVLPMKGTGT